MTGQKGRVLVTGVNGQVGQALLPRLAAEGFEAIPAPREVLDLAETTEIAKRLDRLAPDMLVNCAAFTAVDQAEQEPSLAFAVNAKAPEALAAWCAGRHVPMVQLSTDYVFAGAADRPYREDDPTGPQGVYGASKLAGEERVRAAGGMHVIIRTAWVYSATGKNFVRTMLRLGRDREALRVVADQRGCPTAATNIADAVVAVLGRLDGEDASELTGIYHYVDAGETTWYGFAEAIFAQADAAWGRRPTVAPIATVDYPTPARRPAYSVLDTGKFQQAFRMTPPDWRASLDRILAQVLP